MVFRR